MPHSTLQTHEKGARNHSTAIPSISRRRAASGSRDKKSAYYRILPLTSTRHQRKNPGFVQSAEKMAGKKPSKSPKLDAAENEGAGVEEQEQGEEQQQMLEKVVGVQNEIDRLNEQASEEILHVEQKYNKLRKPCYERRSELIKSVPDFWLSTVSSHSISNLMEL